MRDDDADSAADSEHRHTMTTSDAAGTAPTPSHYSDGRSQQQYYMQQAAAQGFGMPLEPNAGNPNPYLQQHPLQSSGAAPPYHRQSSPTSAFPASQAPSQAPAFAAGASAGGGSSGARRGRKSQPKLPDLQAQLDGLVSQFQRLSQENGFLKNKLKVGRINMCNARWAASS
jgi:hypothetical protein